MSADIENWTLDGIKNPLALQGLLLDEFESSSGGKYTIADGNNVVAFLMYTFSHLASGLAQKIDDTVLPAIYPSRAVSISDMYKHLSDYEYLGLFASPAQSEVILIVDKGYLMRHAVPVYANDGTELYRKVVIPRTARFRLGSKTFGIYYPIEIKISNNTGMFTVEYDTSVKNPLHILTENVLTHKFYTHEQTVLAYINIPVYQFDTLVSEEPIVSGAGYKKILTFTDQFYALKCYADVKDENGNWTNKELSLSLSGRTYDPATPTVVFSVNPETKTLELSIPYVYFTNELIRGYLRVEVYTTSGYLNYNIPSNTEELVGLDFFGVALDAETSKYADPLRTMPSMAAVPATMVVTGGTNGMTYDEIRRRILTNSFTDKTLQTPADVDSYFANLGYTTSLYQDGITDRIFIAHSVLRDTNNEIVGAASIDTLVDMNMLTKNCTKTVVKVDEDVYTILPSTRYKFDSEAGVCKPLTDAERDTLDGLDAPSKVEEYNNNIYTMCPFHIQCTVSDRYPSTCTFDLTDVDVESREFLISRDETDGTAAGKQLALNVATLNVVSVNSAYETSASSKVTDAFRLILQVAKSGLDNVASDRLGIFLGLKTLSGSYVWVFSNASSSVGDIAVFTFDILATAAFTQVDGQYAVRIQKPFSDVGENVFLTCEARVICCVLDPDISIKSITNGTALESIIPSVKGVVPQMGYDNFAALSEHRLTLRFGRQINELNQRIALSFAGNNYLKFNTTEMAVLPTPKYKLDANGVPVLKYENGKVVGVEEEYPAGTMICYTESVPGGEVVIVDKNLESNRLGLTYTEIGSDEEKVYDGSMVYDGREIFLKNARAVPRFKITGTKKIAGLTSDAIGTYELTNASRVGKLSKSSDVWIKSTSNPALNYSVTTSDALLALIRNNLIAVSDKQIGEVTGIPNGSFVLVENDTSANGSDVLIGDTSNIVAKLYQRLNDEWKCLIVVGTSRIADNEYTGYESLVKYAEAQESTSVHGYAYLLNKNEEEEAELLYISFLNTTEDGFVDLTPLPLTEQLYKQTEDLEPVSGKEYYVVNDSVYIYQGDITEFVDGVIYYEKDEIIPVDQWANKANKWPWDATVWMSVSGNTSTPDSYFVISIDSGRLYKYVAHLSNHVILDANGKPKLDENNPREVKFMVNMLHLDAKLTEADASSGMASYPANLVESMRAHFSNLGSVKNRLYTNTRLYFEPIRSLGFGKFYTDGETIKELPLDVTMKFRLHVSADVADDDNLMSSMKEYIIGIIDDHMASGSTNMTTLAQKIRDENSDSVKYVDVLGINGDANLQTMRAVDNSIKPHLKHTLVLLDDKETIDVTRGLELEFVVADS
jgi:hypothetical protein